jgi:hypothetical protein
MPKKRFGTKQIVTPLRQIEVLMGAVNLPRRPAEKLEYGSRTTR